MPKVIACYKWVVDEADIKINADQSIDISKAKWKISDYDKNAIEAAIRAAQAMNGTAAALTFGAAHAKPSLKDALSRGPEEAYWINSDLANGADGHVTAQALAAAVGKIGDVSLVICAEGASDTYARQTAPRLGAILDWPTVTSVSKITVDGDAVLAERKLDDCLETVRVKLPTVLAVLPEINAAPLPGLKAVLAAAKKPVTEFTAEALGITALTAKNKVKTVKAYVMERKNIIFAEGDAAQKVKDLAASLKKEGVL
jgi:electron transfer flavoprotein beta subunit